MANLLHIEGKLERFDPTTPWGFRMQGGKDFGSPLTIQKVTGGSLADKCGLREGDIIVKIGTRSAEGLRHQDAQESIKSSGNHLDLLLQRGGNKPQYETFEAPVISMPSKQQYQQPSPASFSPSSSYNAAPKPFSSNQAPRSYSPVTMGAGGDNQENMKNLKNLNISSSQQPSDQPAYDKFAALDDRTALAAGDRSADFTDSNRSAVRVEPYPKVAATGPTGRSYNNPTGLYSAAKKDEISRPAANIGNKGEKKVYQPSETWRLIHEQDDVPPESRRKFSGTFQKLQEQLEREGDVPAPLRSAYQSKPLVQTQPKWEPPKEQHTAAKPSTKPWQGAPAAAPARPQWAPPKPSGGGGAMRGKQGDALMRDPGSAGHDGRIPMCSSCNVAIRGPFVLAMGKSWCPEHFVCANPQCATKLVDIGFVEEGGQIYCERDYERYFAPHCARCQAAIIGTCVNALQQSWHPECFVCTQCHLPIKGGSFHVEDGKPYCDADWGRLFQTKCTSCDFPVEAGDRWVEAMGQNWHAECFNCSMCQVNLEGQPFFPKGGKPYCKKHAR